MATIWINFSSGLELNPVVVKDCHHQVTTNRSGCLVFLIGHRHHDVIRLVYWRRTRRRLFFVSSPNFHGFFFHSVRMSAHKWKRTNYLNVKFVIVTQPTHNNINHSQYWRPVAFRSVSWCQLKWGRWGGGHHSITATSIFFLFLFSVMNVCWISISIRGVAMLPKSLRSHDLRWPVVTDSHKHLENDFEGNTRDSYFSFNF